MKLHSVAESGILCSPKLIHCVFSFFVSLIIMVNTVYGAQLTVAWDPNNDSATVGYKIHYGTQSKSYDSSIDVGNTNQHLVADLRPGTIYFFAATAYDANGNESDFSEELVVNTPSKPIPSAPIPNPTLDSDHDGISDLDEINIYGTDPNNPDTDGDGMSDGQELQLWGSSWQQDEDGDGIVNLLDADSIPAAPKKRVNMTAIYSLLLE